jgi:hypothetical protein
MAVLDTWTVVHTIAAKFKPLVFSNPSRIHFISKGHIAKLQLWAAQCKLKELTDLHLLVGEHWNHLCREIHM